ncbi:MAG: hypothetical protein M1305_03875 [Candidatus Marsarchaeota archaeon]|nr:hypothetical protein [Candidatus Marsarchaeota archaeon]
MRCPDDNAIREDWRRSKRGEPTLNAIHIARCDACSRKLHDCESLSKSLKSANLPATGAHVSPEVQVDLLANHLSRRERERVQAHAVECPECREEIVALAEIVVSQFSAEKVRRRANWLTNSFSALAGAAAVLVTLAFFPAAPRPTAQLPRVVITGTKGGASDAVRALRAIEPSDADLGFAIAVWERVAKDHPKDQIARAKLAELKRRQALMRRER